MHLPLTGSVMGPHGVKSVEMMSVTAAADGSKPPTRCLALAA
jgi:hypothetical protein